MVKLDCLREIKGIFHWLYAWMESICLLTIFHVAYRAYITEFSKNLRNRLSLLALYRVMGHRSHIHYTCTLIS